MVARARVALRCHAMPCLSRGPLPCVLLTCALLAPSARAADPPPRLFDGETLRGWEGDPRYWRVEDGQIVGTITDKADDNQFLIGKVPLADFRLVVEVKLTTATGQNSGIQFRSQKVDEKGRPSVKGYQADIGGPDGIFWCDVYDEHGRGWLFQDGPPKGTRLDDPEGAAGWHVYEIVAVGSKILAALDGKRCFELDDPAGPREGILALQLHAGPAMEVRFRNFRVALNPRPELLTTEYDNNRLRVDEAEPLTPHEALRRMQVAEGFRVELVAAEPRVRQPIAFTFDARGRIWVAESYDYPERPAPGTGKDRLVILEDRDRNGTFETRKVFTEGLGLVSGFELGFGGVWVAAAPELLFIPDRDGDDRPDGPPEVLLDGFDDADTHETPNAFIWGPDGWLYGNHGVFNDSLVGKPGTPYEARVPMSAAVWRYHPTRHVFEVFAHGGSNQWGLDFDPLGEAFMTHCRSFNGGGMTTHVSQGGYYWRQGGQHPWPHAYVPLRAAADHDHGLGGAGGDLRHGGHTHVGTLIYQGDNWPAPWRGRLYTHNLHGGLINVEAIEPARSGYVVRHVETEFWRAGDPWFVGVALRTGPDGAVYMIDWYDRQHCHHRDVEKWDRSNGRIYRIVHGETARKGADLARARDGELVALLGHANDWHARTAQRLLHERAAAGRLSAEVPGALRALVRGEAGAGMAAADLPHRLRALWTLHATGALTTAELRALAADREPLVRAWAVRLATDAGAPDRTLLPVLAQLARREDAPVVRRHLASALQRLPLAARWPVVEALAMRAEDADDPNIPGLLWFGSEPLVAPSLARALALAQRTRIPSLRQAITRRVAMEERGLPLVVAALARAPASEQAGVLQSLREALAGRTGLRMPVGWSAVATRLYRSLDPEVRRPAELLGAQFGDRSMLPELRRTLADRAAVTSARRHALAALLIARDPEAAPVLHGLLDDEEFDRSAVAALARYDHPDTPRVLLAHYAKLPPSLQQAAIGTLSTRATYARALLDAIAAGTIPRRDLTALYARQLARFPEADIQAKLAALWGRTRAQDGDKAAEIAEYKAIWLASEPWLYSAARGRLVYERLCAQCHTLFGEGGQIGPDLTGSPRHDIDYLLDNIVDPSQLIGKDYQQTVLETTDGEYLSGLVQGEDDRTLTLQTLTETRVLDKRNIKSRELSDSSMMPEGLLLGLSPAEIQNLLKYLAGPAQVARPPAAP